RLDARCLHDALPIYPLPARGRVELKSENAEVKLLVRNILGKELLRIDVFAHAHHWDVSDWSAGVYTIELTQANGSRTHQCLVVRSEEHTSELQSREK